MRLKMASKRSPYKEDDEESLPSEVDMQDAWGEFPKYQYHLHQEALKKEKRDAADKRQLVRKTLDKQM